MRLLIRISSAFVFLTTFLFGNSTSPGPLPSNTPDPRDPETLRLFGSDESVFDRDGNELTMARLVRLLDAPGVFFCMYLFAPNTKTFTETAISELCRQRNIAFSSSLGIVSLKGQNLISQSLRELASTVTTI